MRCVWASYGGGLCAVYGLAMVVGCVLCMG